MGLLQDALDKEKQLQRKKTKLLKEKRVLTLEKEIEELEKDNAAIREQLVK